MGKIEFKTVDVDDLVPNPFQPREGFDKESIGELAGSLKSVGEIQPIIVRGHKRGYQIIAGERRWRAAKFAGMKKIPVLVKDTMEENILLESLIENLHRQDLTSIERENAIHALWKSGRWKTKEELGKTLGKSRYFVEDNVMAAITRKKERISATITTRTIRDTAGLEKEDRKQIVEKVKRDELSAEKVREVARVVKKVSKPLKKAILKPKSRVTPKMAEIISELPESRQAEVAKEVEMHRLDEEETRDIVEEYKMELPTPPTKAEVEEIQERHKELQEEMKEILADPDVQRRGKLFRNWLAHQAILNVAGSAFCPVCGANWKNLGWKCHELNVREAEKEAAEKYQEKVKERE